MKKLFSYSMILAAAAMSFASCSKDTLKDDSIEGEETTVLHISAPSIDTKTVFGAKDGSYYHTLWTTNKSVIFSANDTKTGVNVVPTLVGGGTSATFETEFSGLDESGTIYAFSPLGNYSSTPEDNVPGFTGFVKDVDAIYLNIPSSQTPLSNSVDESAQAIVASQSYSKSSPDITMTFQHLLAYGKMQITNFSGTIQSVELKFPENVAGPSCRYEYKTNTLTSKSGSSITLNPANVSANTFWFALAPTAGTTGKMKIIITDTGDDTYTKTIDLTANALPFTAGQVSAFTANFNGIAADVKPNAIYTISTLATNNSWTSGTAYNISADDAGNAFLSLTYSGGGNNGKYYSSDNTWRFYNGGSMTVSAPSASRITKIVLTTNKGSFSVSSGYDSDEKTWTGSSSSVEFTTSENSQIQKIQVWYTAICETPVISYSNPTVTITCATTGATIHYTLDGSDPTSGSAVYSAPFDLTASATVKAIAVKSGYSNSSAASETCEFVSKCDTPVISYINPTVTITCSTAGATIYYTTDGSTPSSTSGTAISSGESFDLTATSTVKAIATKSGLTDSDVAEITCTYAALGTTKLTNENIVAAGSASTSYSTYTLTDSNGYSYSAYAIKNTHSTATSSYHFLQIKKYASSKAYYIQIPTMPGNIQSITMTVSGSSNPMDGGGNTATLYFSSSNSTSAAGTGVSSGTGASSITIDASSLNLNTGYITASGAIRIWDIEIKYKK